MSRMPLKKIVDQIKKIDNLSNNSGVAEALGVKLGTLSQAITRDSVPFEQLVKYAGNKSLSLDWLLTGRGEMRLEPSVVDQTYHSIVSMLDDLDELVEDVATGEDECHVTFDQDGIDRIKKMVGDLRNAALCSNGDEQAVKATKDEGETDGETVMQLTSVVDMISHAMEEYGDDVVSVRLNHAITNAVIKHGMTPSAARLIVDALAKDSMADAAE